MSVGPGFIADLQGYSCNIDLVPFSWPNWMRPLNHIQKLQHVLCAPSKMRYKSKLWVSIQGDSLLKVIGDNWKIGNMRDVEISCSIHRRLAGRSIFPVSSATLALIRATRDSIAISALAK